MKRGKRQKSKNARSNKKARAAEEAKQPEPLEPFPHPFISGDYGTGSLPKTVVELNMMALSASIRSKPNWWEKIKDEKIVAKWTKEAADQGATEDQIKYVLKELEYYNSLRDGVLELSPVDGVWQVQ